LFVVAAQPQQQTTGSAFSDIALIGHQAVVHIGVVRKNSDRLDAHAWVTSNGRVVIGGSPSYLAQFAVLRELREQES
jgi:hypothetical protein